MISKFSNRFRKNLRDTRGVSLLVTIGLTLVLIVIAVGITKMVLGFMQTTKQVERANVAYSVAEGGIEMALYDLSNYKDGYQTDPSKSLCDEEIDTNQADNFGEQCNGTNLYRFVDFVDADLSDGAGFWRLFSRTLPSGASDDEYLIPNPYFVGNKDGDLDLSEWGTLSKSSPLTISLLSDADPSDGNPLNRFEYLDDSAEKKIIIMVDPDSTWDPDQGSDPDGTGSRGFDDQDLMTWTLASIDQESDEFTLQGVIWESDLIEQDCDGDGSTPDTFCFIFDLTESGAHMPDASVGDVYAGEDINGNLSSSPAADKFNRVAAISEDFNYATPYEFLQDLDPAMTGAINDKWTSARLTINLISTLTETSGTTTNSLRYKIDNKDVDLADEYTYIISEGFAGNVKQTIETRFRRESAIPIFSYVIFQ